MKSSYLNEIFTCYYDPSFKNIVNVGSRDGIDDMQLSDFFRDATIHSFECNPEMIPTCIKNIKCDRIKFNPIGLGDKEGELEFFAYSADNPGASSFFKRIDASSTQHSVGKVKISTIEKYAKDIPIIDLLCMDVQGFELNILKGCGERIRDIRYIVLEQPKERANPLYLPEGIHSKYIGAPKSSDIQTFLLINGFVEVAKSYENELEDNVLYKNTRF